LFKIATMEIVILIIIFVYLIVTNNNLSEKLRRLENQIDSLSKKLNSTQKSEPKEVQQTTVFEKPIASIIVEESKPIIDIESKPTPIIETEPKPVAEPKPESVLVKSVIPETTERVVFTEANAKQPIEKKPIVPQKSWWENFKEKNPDLEKFIGENLINKIGILILVLGISYFVKFSIDKGWISEPARVGIGVLCGALVMGIAHRLRTKFAAFSSVFVAGAIAIFYFTIGIAFHEYKLINQTTAFVIMVIITAFSCLISLSYNRKELAVLSLIGGFAVPFMISSGQGNYVVLFTYILILDIGILAMAYFKKWSIINLLAFIFTVALFAGWLSEDLSTEKPHYLGALVFATCFYFLFILINIINNVKTKGEFSTLELSILASNSFLFFSAGMVILNSFHPEFRGLFTTLLGIVNFTYAYVLYKKFGLDKRAVYLLIGLTLTFVTLAIPIQFKGNYITLFWAAEAVLLLWLSQKSKIVAYKFVSVIVLCLMLLSLFLDWNKFYDEEGLLSIVLNKVFITGIVVITALIFTLHLLKNETENSELFGIKFNPIFYKNVLVIITVLVGYIVGILEVSYQAEARLKGYYADDTLSIIYHLLFTTILFYFLIRKTEITWKKIAIIIGSANIILYPLWFSNYAFLEHVDYVSAYDTTRISYYLHFVNLAFICYLAISIYKNAKDEFVVYKNKAFPWILAAFVVFFVSKELLLNGEFLSNSPVTLKDVKAQGLPTTGYPDESQFSKLQLAETIIEDTQLQIVKIGFPVLWGLLAFIFLIYGIKKQNKSMRIIALVLLGITILKLFLYDISNVSETGKIIAFILLGILILVISFVYQKIKTLVVDDVKKDEV